MKKILSLVLAVLMLVSVFAGCTPAETTPSDTSATAGSTGSTAASTYTYNDWVSSLASNWNPHTYQTSDDSYPIDFIAAGFYSFIFNDELHPAEGFDDFSTYVIVPEMAASEPVDVTEKIKASHPQYGIPASAKSGYAYTIALNPKATWQDGTPIKAEDYVKSMEYLLDPRLLNYRASDYYGSATLSIAGAEKYNKALTKELFQVCGWAAAETMIAEGKDVYIDCWTFWGATGYTDKDGNECPQYVKITDETVYGEAQNDAFSGKMLWDNYAAYFQAGAYSLYKTVANEDYNENYTMDSVGIFASGEYEITLVLDKSLSGFYLLYSLTSNWLVKTDLYEANLKESNGVWSSTYNTSAETTCSYGPYIMTSFQQDKAMRFTKNENWYGYTDGQHDYVDPEDGKTYTMYQTTDIYCQEIAKADTAKMMFLKGELMSYGLQSADFATYRNSEYCYATPADTIFFLILNGHMESIKSRESAADFDKSTTDLESMTLLNFRKAMAITYDREAFAANVSPSRTGGYGIIGNTYIYDPDTGAKYRDTDEAKKVLCDFYSVDVSKYPTLDDAVASITGYDPETAAKLFQEAYKEALDLGYITDTNNDGISDQTVTIEYAMSGDVNDFMTTTINYLNSEVAKVTKGTGFEGKIQFTMSANYGNQWSDKLKNGLADTALAGWQGSRMNPFSLTDLYVNPSNAYDAGWFDPESVDMTVNIDGKDITMNLTQWSDALNGVTVTVKGTDYNFGDGNADIKVRLTILAAFEGKILETYDYLPILQNAGMSLLSQQVYYVVEEYNGILGRGGIAYMKYNYDDVAWAAYVKEQGGELKY